MVYVLKIIRRNFRILSSFVRYSRVFPFSSLIMPGCVLARDLKVGRECFIGRGAIIGENVELGDFVMMGPKVSIIGNDHIFDRLGVPVIKAGKPSQYSNKTLVGSDVWIGANVTIMRGVKIGAGAVVGAGSLVLRDVAPNTIIGGVPATVLRKRFSDQDFCDHLELVNGLLEGRNGDSYG